MTRGQCPGLYLGLALLKETGIAQHRLRSPMPASYADLTPSAHSFLLIRNELASEYGRAVHPRALKTHTWVQSPPWCLTDWQRARVPSERKQEAKALA